MNRRFQLGLARIDQVSRLEAVAWVLKAAASGPCRFVVTPNSDHIVMLENNSELQKVYAAAHLVVADGMPLVWASRILGPSLPERVTGSELMPRLCEAAAPLGLKIFLLGAGPGVARQAQQALEKLYPQLRIVGCHSPPLGFEKQKEEGELIISLLKAAAPDIIFVGLGAPKQELWMLQAHQKLDKGVMLGVGAAIDFCAGHVKRAPAWMQKLGLEWLFRLYLEPKRLARRYLRDTLVLWIIVREIKRRIKT